MEGWGCQPPQILLSAAVDSAQQEQPLQILPSPLRTRIWLCFSLAKVRGKEQKVPTFVLKKPQPAPKLHPRVAVSRQGQPRGGLTLWKKAAPVSTMESSQE